ncbi:hypothetical protein LX12_004344 [Williamsia serinedens]|uniref:Uncharacterized protein n=2 Tax=Williamsia serinedens TaxID=391736 RepID=A0ABT1H7A1_9NOCA|nr:hypothetical protein [Williamsia serinedens]
MTRYIHRSHLLHHNRVLGGVCTCGNPDGGRWIRCAKYVLITAGITATTLIGIALTICVVAEAVTDIEI